MGSIRVTQRILTDRVLRNIHSQSQALLKLQEQLSTGLRVNRPSDDPLAVRRGIRARADASANEQYSTTISTTSPFLLESETTILSVEDAMRRVYELTLQGMNDTNSQVQRNQIAVEVNQILEHVLTDANHFSNGRYVFGGTRTLQKPFDPTRNANGEVASVAYLGNDEHFQVGVGDGIKVDINETGTAVFSNAASGGVDVFQLLVDIRDNLRSSNVTALGDNLTGFKRAEEQFLTATARIGSVESRLERVDANLQDANVQLQQTASDNLDADFAEVMTRLNAQSNAFQASLNAASRVIQPSLLDFIR